jgi:hypothetical protein
VRYTFDGHAILAGVACVTLYLFTQALGSGNAH